MSSCCAVSVYKTSGARSAAAVLVAFFFSFFPLLQASADASDSIADLLSAFVAKGASQLFDGTFIYLYGDQVQTIKVHRSLNDKGQVIESFTHVDQPQENHSRILVNQYCTLKNGWQYQFNAMSSSFPFRINNHYKQLQKYYQFKSIPSQKVANVATRGLRIKARDPYRYSYKLWFEPQSATLMKYQLLDEDDKIVEQYLFTDISFYPSTVYPSTVPTISGSQQNAPSCDKRFEGLQTAITKYLNLDLFPAGFEPVSYRKARINHDERQAEQFQISDGLADVSLFIEDVIDKSKHISGVMRMGPMTVAGKTLGTHQITVIGAIPVAGALNILNAVKVP